MNTNNRVVQFVVGGIAFLLLAVIGVITFDTASSLTKLEETLNTLNPGLVENPAQPVATAQPSANNVTDVSGSNPTDQSGDTGGNVSGNVSGDAGSGDQPFDVVLPSDNTLYLSSLSLSIQLQLKADVSITASNVSARLLIFKRVLSATDKETLAQGFSSDEVKLESFQPPTANITFNFQKIPPTGKYEGLLIVTGDGITPLSKLVTIEVTSFPTDDANLTNFVKLAIHLPSIKGDDKTMILSRDLTHLVFQLENLDNQKSAKVTAQLVIAKSVDDNKKETIIPGYTSLTADVELKPFETKNVTLDLGDRLPPSGTYVAWLMVGGDASQTVMEKMTLIVSADPQVAIQNRLTNAAEGEKNITIGGLRNYPTWTAPVFGLVFGPVVTVPSYDLTVWEANLQAANCTLIPSELADKANGRTGILSVDNLTPCKAAQYPVTVKLTPSGIFYPGSYAGTLRIIIPGAVQNEVTPVTVLVRDRLIWPALVIFLGALVAGYAVRYALGEGRKNVAYLRYQIKHGQILAGKPGKENIKDEVEIYLILAGLNLDIYDLDSASKYIKQAYEKLGYELKDERAVQEQQNTGVIQSIEDQLEKLRNQVRLVGLTSTFVWAAIATVAGLIYIDARLPTFGSPQDYILALAWALGLSSAAKPAENIAAGILKSLTGQDQQANDGQDDPAKKNDKQSVQNTDEIVVPLVMKKSQDEATKILENDGLVPSFKSEGARQTGEVWVVKDPTDPKAGAKVKKGETVNCTLIPQKADGDGNTGDDPGIHGSVP
jgi:hypothetical protein